MVGAEEFLKKFQRENPLDAFAEKGDKFPLKGVIPNKPIRKKIVRGDIGIEVEVEGRSLPSPEDVRTCFTPANSKAFWDSHRDGSLRGESSEYVLSYPIKRKDVDEAVDSLQGLLFKQPTRLVPSNRTSCHVHINVGGMKVNTLSSFMAMWLTYEDALIEWCGTARKNNHFALSNSATQGWMVEEWIRALKKGSFDWGERVRYGCLNLSAFSKFGSLEFRCFGNIENNDKLKNWAKLLYALKTEAENNVVLPSRWPGRISLETPHGALRDIMERSEIPLTMLDEIVEATGTVDDFNNKCMDSFRDCQELCYVINWENWEEEFSKEFVENPFDTSGKIKKKIPRVGIRPFREVVDEEDAQINDIRRALDNF